MTDNSFENDEAKSAKTSKTSIGFKITTPCKPSKRDKLLKNLKDTPNTPEWHDNKTEIENDENFEDIEVNDNPKSAEEIDEAPIAYKKHFLNLFAYYDNNTYDEEKEKSCSGSVISQYTN